MEIQPEVPRMQPPGSPGQAFTRGARLICPMCGEGKLFKGWFRMAKGCARCGFVFERDPGYFLGATYINYGLTTLISTWTYIVLRFVLAVGQGILIPVLATFCVVFPVVFFRYARSLWLAFDCYLDPSGALESRSERHESGVEES